MERAVRDRLAPKNGATAPLWHLASHAAETSRPPRPNFALGRHLFFSSLFSRQYSHFRSGSTVNLKKTVRFFAQINLHFKKKGLKLLVMMLKTSRRNRTSSYNEPLSRRIGDLKRERAELQDEVLQLRAAVQIWTEVWRRTMYTAAGSEAFSGEMR